MHYFRAGFKYRNFHNRIEVVQMQMQKWGIKLRIWIYPMSLLLAAGVLWLYNYWHPNVHLVRLASTIIAFMIIFIVFEILLKREYVDKIADSQKRYYTSKAFYFIFILLNFFAILLIWVEDLQALIVSFGLVAAAFTITMQDVAKNFVGGLSIFLNKIYRVGDRIEIGSKKGDVIDIDIFYTTIMEINEWLSGDQPTGRISIIPNGQVLSNVTNNYTKDFNFLWDEISIPLTYGSDWVAAKTLMIDIINEEIDVIEEESKKAISHMEKKYYLSPNSINKEVFIKLTDNWIELTARYVVPVRQRRTIRSRINQKILEHIEKSDNIKIASETVNVVGFPDVHFSALRMDK
jgi:small-conductance mechanosensitive channel